jgi:outer membrane receptor protein involved in Fe transport
MNPTSPALSQLAFHQETADSVQAGLRAVSADGVWRASTGLFHTSFNDYQFSYFTGLNRRTQNVPKLVTKGIEAEAAFRPALGFELSASGIYQEAIFGDSGFPAALIAVQGTTAPIAPRWVLVGSASYELPLAELGVTGFGDINVRWQSKSNVGGSGAPSVNFQQDAYAVFGMRIGVEAPNRNWRVEFWARNLFNQRAWSVLNNTTLQPGSISGYVTDPRSVGVTATLAW